MMRLFTGLALTTVLGAGIAIFASDSGQKNPGPQTDTDATEAASDPKKSDRSVFEQDADNDEKSGQGDGWMAFKLTSSQAMFAELTRGNMDRVAKHAHARKVIVALEYWLRGREFRQRSEYHKQLNRYQFAVREMARHAGDGNVDGALESWLSISRSCVECHKLLRDQVRRSDAPDNSAATPRKQ